MQCGSSKWSAHSSNEPPRGALKETGVGHFLGPPAKKREPAEISGPTAATGWPAAPRPKSGQAAREKKHGVIDRLTGDFAESFRPFAPLTQFRNERKLW